LQSLSQNYISELFNLTNSDLLFLQKDGESFAKIEINKSEYLVFFNHDLVNEIGINQSGNFVKGLKSFPLKRIMGNGILTSDGELHLRDRRIIQPAFSKEKIEEYLQTFTKEIKDEILSWEDEKQIDFYTAATELLLSVITNSLFNFDFSKTENFNTVIHLLIDNNFANDYYQENGADKVSFMLQQKDQVKTLSSILQSIIDKRRDSGSSHNDVLDILLDNQDVHFSDKEIRDHLATLIVSGYRTTLSLVSWSIFLISQNKDILKELQEEADACAWIQEDRPPTLEEIHSNYGMSKKIIKETLRMYPPVWFLIRQAKEDVHLDQIDIPRGSNVIVSQYVLHRNDNVFSSPETWNPYRWTKEFEKSLPKGSYIPFGLGTRKCIGYDFAIAETQMILLLMAKNFSWESLQDPESFKVKPSITLRPQGDVPILLQERRSDEF
jgi:cytochrome P450